MDDGKAESDDDNNDQPPGDPVGRPYGLRGPRVIMDLKIPKDPCDQ